jgi:hypothetical protein
LAHQYATRWRCEVHLEPHVGPHDATRWRCEVHLEVLKTGRFARTKREGAACVGA